MEYRGHVENGKVILDEPALLPDGTEVSVHPLATARKRRNRGDAKATKHARERLTVTKRLLRYAGCIDDLPSDASRNLDHYLYGHAKR